MKIRKGFVSNSSSSSFIVVRKVPMTDEELLEEMITISGVLPTSFLYDAVKVMCKCLIGTDVNGVDEILRVYEFDNDYYNNYPKTDMHKAFDMARENGWQVGVGSATNEGDPEQYLLCEIPVNINNDKIIIVKDGGF